MEATNQALWTAADRRQAGEIPRMRQATLCLPVRGDPPTEVLLGFKKAGFGVGKYTGFGGKVETGETVAQAAVREMQEETGVTVAVDELEKVGELAFVFPSRPLWSQEVHVFLAYSWRGEAVEGREMRPVWFPVACLPYEEMWDDGATWMPRVLAGDRIQATFTFGGDNETVDKVEVSPLGPSHGSDSEKPAQHKALADDCRD